MRVAVYDANPGPGIWQWFLCLTWQIGCALHKLFGKLDDYHAATSWDDAMAWLLKQPGPLASVQYWGHGSPALIWLGGQASNEVLWVKLKPQVTPTTVVWFRVCSVFQGREGHIFAKRLAAGLGCTIAAHTRVIGVFQSGLHTCREGVPLSWSQEEGEFPKSIWAYLGLKRGNNTIFCLRSTIPPGW